MTTTSNNNYVYGYNLLNTNCKCLCSSRHYGDMFIYVSPCFCLQFIYKETEA